MSITTTITRPSAGEPAVLPQPAERYIPKVTNIDPDIAIRRDRPAGTGGWAARIPVLNWFVPR
jgi:hypothetical protein